MLTTSGTYPWSFISQIFHNGQPSHGGDQKTFKVMTSTLPKGTFGSVASLIASTLYQGNPDMNHKLWNVGSTERYILYMQALMECWKTCTNHWFDFPDNLCSLHPIFSKLDLGMYICAIFIRHYKLALLHYIKCLVQSVFNSLFKENNLLYLGHIGQSRHYLYRKTVSKSKSFI